MLNVASASPQILFRTDASIEIGTGHVMRCLTLADALRDCGKEAVFVCRRHPGHLVDLIHSHGHGVRVLSAPTSPYTATAGDTPHAAWAGVSWEEDADETLQLAPAGEQADWLVVDHYALDHRWEKKMRGVYDRLLVIDDLADRTHDCDLLLDPGLGREAVDYDSLVRDDTRGLFGPQYALLRPEFSISRAEGLARHKSPELRQVLITMGGTDKDNATGAVLDALDRSSLPPNVSIVAVMGANSPWLEHVRVRATRMRFNTQVHAGVTDMAQLMASSDLAIGAGGGTSWERCCVGLPTFLLSLADNQKVMARTLQHAGAVIAFESVAELARRLDDMLAKNMMMPFLARSSHDASQITDGLGVKRVCQEMLR